MGGWRRRCKRDSLAAFAQARVLLAAVSLAGAWQRNLFHPKTSLDGTSDIAATCQAGRSSEANSRNTSPYGRSGSQAVRQDGEGEEKTWSYRRTTLACSHPRPVWGLPLYAPGARSTPPAHIPTSRNRNYEIIARTSLTIRFADLSVPKPPS